MSTIEDRKLTGSGTYDLSNIGTMNMAKEDDEDSYSDNYEDDSFESDGSEQDISTTGGT